MELLGDVGHVESRFSPFGDSVSLKLLGDEAQVEARFGLFGDSANFDARLVHGFHRTYQSSEIILDAPDGTPR